LKLQSLHKKSPAAKKGNQMDTGKNLDHCFERNCQAYIKFLAFAAKAEAEEHQLTAKLFRAAAGARKIHIDAYMKTAALVKSTADNLKTAIDCEVFEADELYPEYIQTAKNEACPEMKHSFIRARSAKMKNIRLYESTLAELGRAEPADCFLCSVCGYLHKGIEAVDCPVCGTGPEALKRI
jgi:rubrerythrin